MNIIIKYTGIDRCFNILEIGGRKNISEELIIFRLITGIERLNRIRMLQK